MVSVPASTEMIRAAVIVRPKMRIGSEMNQKAEDGIRERPGGKDICQPAFGHLHAPQAEGAFVAVHHNWHVAYVVSAQGKS